ncbi:hypothetical protein [Ohtaekwangia sp.]|uniref:hypothetical protein n=1 Tax=Ohtaekwangia sp. TaxID=2066019 RepID=UPI002FDE457F
MYEEYGAKSFNLVKFEEGIKKGLSRQDAALGTITGMWATEKGFNKVNFIEDAYDIENRVEVIFEK